eukprot:SAG31_NODE_43895_length_265_cov_0.626506_2_plen_36_part_01
MVIDSCATNKSRLRQLLCGHLNVEFNEFRLSVFLYH